MEIMIKLKFKRAAMSFAVVATVVLAGGLGSPLASAEPDDDNPIPDPEPCYMWVPGSEGRCLPACYGEAPTVGVPPGGGSFNAPPGPQVIVGTSGDDRIFAADDDDIICGLAGVDSIWGGGGEDSIYGGDDGDVIHGDEDDDFLLGQGGGDIIYGDGDDDTIWGGGDADGLSCGPGVGSIDGGGGPAIDFILPNEVCANVTRVEVL
jgi:Ca2+-binding RTX toxin-like protein